MSKLEELKRHNAASRKRIIDPEQEDEGHGQNDDYDTDKHAGSMFLAILDEKKVLVDVPRKVDPRKLGIDLIGNIIMTGLDEERLMSLKSILQKSPGKVSIYMTQAMKRDLEEKLGDFDKVDEHIVKEARDFDVNGVNVTLMKVKGSDELKVILRSGEEYHQGNWISKEDIREKLASMIHNEWMSWSKAVAGDVDPEKRAKWEKLWIPYDQLTEHQKDQDRVWADKVLRVMHALNKGEDELVDILKLIKAKGVAVQPGPPPGPPPRPELQWKPDTHRWTHPFTVLEETPENTKADWHELKDTVTLYHGTTERLLESIGKNGMVPPDPAKIVDDTIRAAGIDPDKVPKWVKREADYRKDPERGPTIYLSSNYQQAAGYSDRIGGEIESMTYQQLEKWATQAHRKIKPFEKSEPVVIKLEVPVDSVFTHGNKPFKTPVRERFQEVVDNYKKNTKYPLEPEEIGFEIVTQSTISPDHIKAVIRPSEQFRVKKAIKRMIHMEVMFKARGVASQPGPAPGPAPREGLQWNPPTHRWHRPEDAPDQDERKPMPHGEPSDEKIHSVEADFIGNFATAEIEHCVVLDNTGKVMFTKKGSKDSVFFTREESNRLYGAEEFIHNHPFGGGSFSFEDIITQYKLHIKRMVLVNGDQKFTLELGDKDWRMMSSMNLAFQLYTMESTSVFLRRALERYFEVMQKAHAENAKITRSEDVRIKQQIEADEWVNQTDHIWKVLAKRYDFKYTRETVDVDKAVWDKIERDIPKLMRKVKKAIDLSQGYTLDDSEMWVPDEYHKTLEEGKIVKAQGVPEGYGAPPGPPPRPGLEWKPETHRWIRPGEEHTDQTSQVQYETENKDMEEALAALKAKSIEYEELGDEWNNETTGILKDNADAHLEQYEKFFDASTYNKARSAAYAIINTARGAKTSASPKDVQDLVTSSIDKLVYQEMRAWERQVSDHGIRHIVGNIIVQDRISKALINGGMKITPQDRFMLNVIAINHDMGYTMGDARTTIEGTKKHKRYSQEYFDHEREFFKKFFDDSQLDLMSDIIAHHDDTTIDWDDDPLMTTVCMADNLSLFQEDKLPSLYRYVDGALDSLYEMQKGLRVNDPDAVTKAKEQLFADIDASKLPEYSKSWLRQAANEVSKYTAKYTIPMLVGNVEGFNFDESKGMEVDINEDPFDDKVADVIDMGQTQYAKFAKDYGVDLKDSDNVEFKRNGRTLLTLKIRRHQMEKMMYGEHPIDIIFKAGKKGLVPKKVMVHREGKDFLQTVYVKPGAGQEDLYNNFLQIPYGKFFGKRSSNISQAIMKLSEAIITEKKAAIGEEHYYRSHMMMVDWVEGVFVRMVAMRMLEAKITGVTYGLKEIQDTLASITGEPSDEKSGKFAMGVAEAMNIMMDDKGQISTTIAEDTLKAEKEFAQKKTHELYGDHITVYRGIYGTAGKKVFDELKKNGKVDLEELPLASYSQDKWGAMAFVMSKPNYVVFRQVIPADEVVTAWYSNNAFLGMMPEQKEVVIDRKQKKFTVTKADIELTDEEL